MPSHQDRVRRNYHNIIGVIQEDPITKELIFNYRITKVTIASWMDRKNIAKFLAETVYRAALKYNDQSNRN